MTSLTGILSLLSALIATSDALSCTQCMSVSSSSCSGPSVSCSPGHQCGSAYTKTSVAGQTSEVLVRGCVPSSECDVRGGMNIQYGQIKMVTSCCNSDNCAPTIPSLPSTGSNPNGLVCRSCMSADSTWCYTPDTIECTGDMDRCFLMTTKTTGSVSSSVAIRGCTTKSICERGSRSSKIEGLSSEVKFTCTSGGMSVHGVILTPAIACLLMLKLFF
ncbi:phospholipase A2 inhibitor and Ly6/PLAUR domain-containing protein-like [Dendropsophus ebraccatus]|uniref:phospholipase A2 inhibitor and Ly6/PLAUR domain-containing protein-like n=1 Tax=Dendropsophus ebraccatus TaxID=150705 RepID=UPI00383166D0